MEDSPTGVLPMDVWRSHIVPMLLPSFIEHAVTWDIVTLMSVRLTCKAFKALTVHYPLLSRIPVYKKGRLIATFHSWYDNDVLLLQVLGTGRCFTIYREWPFINDYMAYQGRGRLRSYVLLRHAIETNNVELFVYTILGNQALIRQLKLADTPWRPDDTLSDAGSLRALAIKKDYPWTAPLFQHSAEMLPALIMGHCTNLLKAYAESTASHVIILDALDPLRAEAKVYRTIHSLILKKLDEQHDSDTTDKLGRLLVWASEQLVEVYHKMEDVRDQMSVEMHRPGFNDDDMNERPKKRCRLLGWW